MCYARQQFQNSNFVGLPELEVLRNFFAPQQATVVEP